LLDVRSPGEFQHGHWPAAHNLPLFSDEERAEVGTLYKRSSPDEALLRGLELVGPKMRMLIEESRLIAEGKEISLHCWRGGQRSQSVAWLLEKGGAKVQVIEGGYKALRAYGREQLQEMPLDLLILGGPTGSGKTKILQAMAAKGSHFIDLEGLAHHKGSSFGALGEVPQPTVEQFENDLFAAFLRSDTAGQPLWLENESRSIGRVYIPEELWRRMLTSPVIRLEMPMDWRIEQLVADYALFPKEDLKGAFTRISKRLGGQHVQAAHRAIDQGNFADAAVIALHYYDKAYQMSLQKNEQKIVFQFKPQTGDIDKIATELLNWHTHYLASPKNN
jgi:tRNA 2-selenouridine synthase